MAKKRSVKRFVGVYYSESKVRKWRERPDRIYWLNFRDSETGKLIWERCGWASEGWTPEASQKRRYELLEQQRAGNYKSKRERTTGRLTFGDLMTKHYLPWADEEKKRARDDHSLYRVWLRPRFAKKMLKEISSLDLERLKKEMREAGRAEATVKHALCLVRQAYNKAVGWHLWHGENPCSEVKFPNPNNKRQRFLSKEEARDLVRNLKQKDLQLSNIVALALWTGARLREILALTWSRVDFVHGYLLILDSKTGEPRHIHLSDRVQSLLKSIPHGRPDEPIFMNSNGEHFGWLSKEFKRTVDDLGLNEGKQDRREQVCFHTLRHTYASWAVMAGVSLFKVGKSMGISTTVVMERYAHLAPEGLKEAYEAVAKYDLAGSDHEDEPDSLHAAPA